MKIKSASGFTFIEVMVGIVIVSIAAYGLLLSATHARGELRAVAIRERATDELIGYMEFLKGRIADGNMTITEKSGDFNGTTVYLWGNQNSAKQVPAKMYYENIVPVFTDSLSYIDRYLLHAWIEWEDFSTPGKHITKREDLQLVMLEFPQ